MGRGLSERLTRVDAVLGAGIEKTVVAKHRWRLARLGSGALTPDEGRWAKYGFPPREGCEIEVLVDGATAFPAIAQAIERAQESVYITGWHIAPHFEVVRGESGVAIGALLAEVAERADVRVLVWAGSPVPAFHPTRKEVSRAVRELTRETHIRCKPDPREHPFHCHHEKTVVVDGRIAFVGGIDMTDLAGDRYDTNDHPARRRLGWHDVGTKLTGAVVHDVSEHFALRWHELTGEHVPLQAQPPPTGSHTVQVIRTVAEGMYGALPRGEFGILESYLRSIRDAERFIYLENQFLWAPEIVSRLAEKLRHPPRDEFRLAIVLPSRANNGHDDTRGQLAVLESADRGHGRLCVATLQSLSGARADRLYVHAKVGIIDDRWLTIGSANLNAHSLFNDTELNIACDDPLIARETRVRLWSEHLQVARSEIEHRDPCSVIDDGWKPVLAEQLERLRSGKPPTRHLMGLPGVSRRSSRLLGPLVGLADDG